MKKNYILNKLLENNQIKAYRWEDVGENGLERLTLCFPNGQKLILSGFYLIIDGTANAM